MSITSTIYNFAMKDITGKAFDTSALKGKVVLIFNSASRCGFTSQLKGLEDLHEKHSANGLVILGFPSNEFGRQEPGTGAEIKAFCEKNYGVKFQMMEKTITNGPDANPLYSFLKKGTSENNIAWNFEKFLVGKDGKPVARFPSSTTPAALEKEIAKIL